MLHQSYCQPNGFHFWASRFSIALICPLLIQLLSAQPASTQLNIKRETRDVCGWKLHIDERLLQDGEVVKTVRAVELLQQQLEQIIKVVPKPAREQLQQVPLYFSPPYSGTSPRAEFHPSQAWLRENGRDPFMAESVEFTNVAIFEKELDRMPNFALHELAHAYHFRFVKDGFDNAEIKAAFQRAQAGGQYDKVQRWLGRNQKTAMERSYAMTNAMEYFAETTEAYFARNDFFPFTRDELKQVDAVGLAMIESIWKVNGNN